MEYLDFAIELARTAGDVLKRYMGREKQVEFKGRANLVTAADKESEALIINRIRQRYPNHAILAEESDASGGGEDNGSRTTLMGAIESAQRADTLVYTILFRDPAMDLGPFGGMGRRGGGMNRPDGKQVMQQFAGDTRARFFEVSKRMPIDKVFASIEEDLRNQYSLGYSPDPPSSGGYHRIHLTTKQKGLIVQTREGYYPS